MTDDDRHDPYDVGFGKPPQYSRFCKGRSGNPKGRPKGKLNLATLLDRALQEKVVINEHGERKTVTKGEAIMKQVVNRAASGELAAVRMVTMLETRPDEQSGVPLAHLEETDLKVVQSMLKRFEQNAKAEDADDQ